MSVRIDPIFAESTPGGFLRSARLLPDDIDWHGGVTFTPSCGGADVYGCSYVDTKQNIDQKGDPIEFNPFLLYSGKECSGGSDEEELTQLAKISLRRGSSSALARELHSSNAMIGNPDLVSTAVDITPGTVPCIKNAIAGLITTSANCGGGELTFHAPSVALASLMEINLVEFSNGRYRLGGHTIIVDDYPNEGPTGAAAPTANQAWIYATGPVEYKLGKDIDVPHFTTRQNTGIVLAERMAILRFDTCCVHAILAELC